MTVTGVDVVVHTGEVLAESVAARLLVKIIDAQARYGSASLVLTGGRIAERTYRAVAASPVRAAVDWGRVDFWWGDERHLPAGDPDRNETQARAAFMDALPVDPARVHPVPPADRYADAAVAAAVYRDELFRSGESDRAGEAYRAGTVPGAGAGAGGGGVPGRLPRFDVVLLGVGEDGHVASVFPGSPALHQDEPVVPVLDSPKPPPVRVTLTPAAIDTAGEVWLIAAGSGKADAIGVALAGTRWAEAGMSGAGAGPVPAARVRGLHRTLWLLDRAAAARLPG